MIKTRSVILMLSAAITVAALAFFISVKRYEPLYEDRQNKDASSNSIKILSEDPILGNKEASTAIIAFEDMGRGRYREQMRIFYQLLDQYPNQIKIIWKSLDITQFPYSSELAHSYAYCANQQNKFTEFEKIILDNDDISENSLKNYAAEAGLERNALADCLLLSPEIANYKEINKQLAAELGIKEIPTVFIKNEMIDKPLTMEGWLEILSM